MRGRRLYNFLWFFLVLALALFQSNCSPQKKYKTLSFFFDGVPAPDTLDPSTQSTSESADTVGLMANNQRRDIPKEYIHEPYGERTCELCHNPRQMRNLLFEQPDLCYQCHTDYSDQHLNIHGPVASGYCTACHNPHKSKNAVLLTRTNEQLCYYCHDSEMIEAGDYHFSIDEKNCTECHNPHGEITKQYLKASICKDCHGDFNDDYAYLHGPVAADYCNFCHGSHLLDTKYNLTRSGQQVCTECHEMSEIKMNEIHEDIGEMDCTECHNPHGGDDRFILR
jgi:predicted CXXCH cytochrome family protein